MILLINYVSITDRQEYVFWVDFTNDRIIRGRGIETPSSTYTTLVTSGITCAGKLSVYLLIIDV